MASKGLSQKQLINELVLQEHLYRSLVEASPEAIIVSDMKWTIMMVNKQAMQLHGAKSSDEMVGKNVFEFVVAEDRARAKKNAERVLKQGKILNQRYKLLKKNAEAFPAEVSASLIVDAKGKPTSFIIIVHDITEREKAENALKESERKYRTLLKNIPQKIFYKSMNSTYIICNESYANDLNIKPEQIKGKTDYDFHPKKLADKYRKDDKRILRSGKGEEIEEGYVKNGREETVRTYKAPVRDERGRIIGIFGIFWDVTHLKKIDKNLELSNINLSKMNKRLREVALKDVQTGLYNHHYLAEIIEAHFARAKKYGTFLSLIMLDIDYFKSINDVYGHRFGDLVLKQFALYLKKVAPKYDTVVRFGGEEFIILSFGRDSAETLFLAHKILDDVNIKYFGNGTHSVKLKLSIGVSSYPQEGIINGTDLIDIADKIISKAKENGGNKVYASEDMKAATRADGEKNVANDRDFKMLSKRLEKLTKKSHESLVEAIFAFAKTIELKDHYTGEHVDKTVSTATDIAKALSLPKENIEHIRQAATLHDLGKIGISEKILLKKAKLTKKEFEIIKKHPQIAVDILRPIQVLHDIIPLIFYHHERWDGKGYPSGLKAGNIPIGARIIALADVYQALISDRPYRKAYPKRKVLQIIKDGRGSQFDPKIVDVFLKIIAARNSNG